MTEVVMAPPGLVALQDVLTDRYKDFDVDQLLRLADALCQYDDPFRALEMLKLLPGHFRQWEPEKVRALRLEIERAIVTPATYAEGFLDTKGTYEDAMAGWKSLPRARLVQEEVKMANAIGLVPHIVDQGPGHFWLPIGLLSEGLKFTYKPVGLDRVQFELSKPHIESVMVEPAADAPVFYTAFEIIEHLFDTKELAYESLRSSPKRPSVVFVSTPHGCFDCRSEAWRTRGMGHVRTYTQREFVLEMERVFDYCDRWQMYLEGPILMATGFSEDVPWRKPAGG
jgi:hypothetical protein